MAPGDTLLFGPFKFEPRTGRLTKRGYKIKLQPKAAAALACLLEQPSEVVSRAQLQAKLWPKGTYVDFELGIKGAIKKLRDALGDDSDEPVYIQTVHGEGYRFLVPVSTVAAETNPGSATEAVPQPPTTLLLRADRRTMWFGAMVGVVTLVIPALLIPRVANTPPVNFQSRDWVVIAAFENRTGEKLLDGTMEFALERALGQSRYVNVAPRDRINDTLLLMRQKVTAVLTEDLARQVAVRDGGIKAVLAGRVEKFGPKYVLTVRLLEPSRGETIAVFEKEAEEKHLPDSARSVSDELRRKLGEKPDAFAKELQSPERVTTPSLAAYRSFGLGMARVNIGDFSQAAPLLEEAVREDPQFASAHIYAAHSYSNMRQPEKAAPHFEAAFRLAPGVSQRERLFILGGYYARYLQDNRRAMDAYRALLNLYPDDYWGWNNLTYIHSVLGMEPQRIEGLIHMAEIRPNNPNLAHLVGLWDYYRFDSPDKTKAKQFSDRLRRLRALGSVPPTGSYDARLDLELAEDRWFNGDVKAAAKEVTRLSTYAQSHGDGRYKGAVVGASLALGKLAEAKALCDKIAEPILRTEVLLRIAYAAGNRELGKKLLSTLRASGPSPGFGSADVITFARFGETSVPTTFFERGVDPEATAWQLFAAGRFAETVKLLQDNPPTRYSFSANRFALANALERLGKREEAIVRLEEENLPGNRYAFNWTWLEYRAKLAELYRKVGRINDAIKVENQLRHYLSEADPDYPILAQLRAVEAATPKIARAK
jgi:DNA-binding winged helix-turn-helix (wHTH) protein/tetratricopeptide (TPR) repeat protein